MNSKTFFEQNPEKNNKTKQKSQVIQSNLALKHQNEKTDAGVHFFPLNRLLSGY